MPIKALLLDTYDESGLKAIRARESELIDVSAYEAGISDATVTAGVGFIIRNNTVYRVFRTYFDLDKKYRLLICKKDMDPGDIIPVVAS